MIEPRTDVEREIFELWKDLTPDSAFALGLEDHAGRLFVPSPANVKRAVARIRALKAKTKDATERKFLAALETRLALPEPAYPPEVLVEAVFMHMVKEGVVPAHMTSLGRLGAKALDATRTRLGRRRWPPGQRALVQLSCQGLEDILGTVEAELKDASALEAMKALRTAIRRYRKTFALPGFRPEADFDEVFAFYKEHGAGLGRARIYPRALRDLWDYEETPKQVEAAGLAMLRREMPRFRSVVEAMAAELGCEPTAEAVGKALKAARGLPKDRILPFLLGVRDVAAKVVDKHVVGINPRYTVQVIETPSYLANLIPSGAAYGLDTLTERAREIFLATTDERSAARPPPAELLNLLVHEEYGHCVHGSNSAHAYAGEPRLLDILNSSFVCVSEGIALRRESEFIPILQEIAGGKLRGAEEDAFVAFFEPWGGVGTLARDYEFLTLLWRVVRILRVIGDARINSGKQDLVAFVEWAHKATGLERSTVYYQLFPAHQVIGPGYASTYAIIGERIRKVQQDAIRKGVSLRDYNAFACSIGWPPKSVYERRLEAWVRERAA